MRPDVSIIVPVYDNALTLPELNARLLEALSTSNNFEIIFVNDACPFGSQLVLAELARKDTRVRVVAQALNGGQNRAVLAGLEQARGATIVVMDADLQDPPEAVPLLLQTLAAQSGGVVFAGRRGSYESSVRMLSGHALRLIRSLLLRAMPYDAGLFVAFDRSVADRLLSYHDPQPYVVALIGRTGARMTSIPVARARHPHGGSGYSATARLRLGWHALAGTLRTRFASHKQGAAS